MMRAGGLLVLACLACGGGDGATSSEPRLTVSVRAEESSLVPGQSTRLVVTTSGSGATAPATAATYASSAPTIASVSAEGEVTAIAPGTTTLTASVGGSSGTTRITVDQGGMLTPAGGTIRMTSGDVEIVAPPGAVQANTPVVLASTNTPWVDPTVARGAVYAIGRDGISFAQPVTVRVRYDRARAPYGLPQSALGLRRAGDSETWIDLRPSTVDSVAGTITATLRQSGRVSVGRLVPTQPCLGASHRSFDFWVGSWNMTSGPQSAGENFITIEPGGCAIYENYVTPTPISPGRSISFYEPSTNRWYQTYIDAGNNMVLLGSRFFDDQSIVMESPPQGAAYTRTTWSRNANGTVRQLVEVTLNNGQTFNVQYDLLYRRK